ncbi:MAG: flagellar biosynthesis protein FlhF [Planctomycetota bacterium]
MYIRTFRAACLQDALEQIRHQMGDDASVLHTRQVRDGWMGWLGKTYVEVTAGARSGLGDNAGVKPAPESGLRADELQNGELQTDDSAHRIIYRRSGDTDRDGRAGQGSSRFDVSGNSTPLPAGVSLPANMDRLSFESSSRHGLPAPLLAYHEQLVASGVRFEVADRWIAGAAGFAAAMGDGEDRLGGTPWIEHLRQSVRRELRIASPIRTQPGDRRVVALVGPTGVGKTTTVAKLAAGFRLEARRRVGLLTIDTFRIAAAEQLRAYADIMELPMEIVETADQMPAAMQRLGDVDLVLIDTAGRSPRSDARIEQLVGLLSAARPDEVHLVISGTSSPSAIETTMQGFAPVGAASVILTKLDEAGPLAGPLSAILHDRLTGGLPISYTTDGQQVPDDIAVADERRLTQHLVLADNTLPHFEAA